jgi:thiamine-phosphate pyrophosphorylase
VSRAEFTLYLITDRAAAGGRDLADVVDAALAGLPAGAGAVQLRDKSATGAELHRAAVRLREVCARRGAALLVNDRADLALALDLDGVHLPQGGLTPADARRLLGAAKRIGVSCHSVAELRAAEAAGADFAVFGPVFATPGKGPPAGLDALTAACASVHIPVYALGGVEAGNAASCVRAGAAGVGAIRAVMAAADPGAAARALLDAFGRGAAIRRG